MGESCSFSRETGLGRSLLFPIHALDSRSSRKGKQSARSQLNDSRFEMSGSTRRNKSTQYSAVSHLVNFGGAQCGHVFPTKGKTMRKQRLLGIGLAVCLLLLGASVYAQMVRPTHPGTVWQLSFIHVKPGMDTAYQKYLATDWKKEQE